MVKNRLQRFYTFSSAVKRGTAWIGSSERFLAYVVVRCDVCGVRGMMPLPRGKRPRVGLKVNRAGTVDDILSLGVGMHAVSRAFREGVRKHGLTGVSFVRPAEVVLARPGARYEATRRALVDELDMKILHVTGRGGSVAGDPRVRRAASCAACGWEAWKELPRRVSTPIVVPEWDGSDFFSVDEWAPVLMTERAAALLSGAAMSNFGAVETVFAAPG